MRRTASHFTKLDSCQQWVCSLDPLYAKYIQYHVWKLLFWNSAPHSLLHLTDYLTQPTQSALFWLTPKLDSVFALLFPPCLFVPYFPFSVLSSVVVHLPPCLHSPFVSLLHPPHLTIAPQCEGWRETWAQWFISKDCTHYRGQDRGWTRGKKKKFFSTAFISSLKQQMTVVNSLCLTEFLHRNHILCYLTYYSSLF